MPPVTGPGNVLTQSLSVHFYCLRGLFSENGSQVSGKLSGDVSGDGQFVVTPVILMRKPAMELVVMQAAAVEEIVVGTSWLVAEQWH